jgi:hypothetical protein
MLTPLTAASVAAESGHADPLGTLRHRMTGGLQQLG